MVRGLPNSASRQPSSPGVQAWPGRATLKLFTTTKAIGSTVAAVTVLPIAFVVVNSFNVARPGQAWTPGLDGWRDALFGSPRTIAAIGYSAVLALRAPIAVAAAFFIAWLLIRVQVPGHRFIEVALWAAFFLPPLPMTLAWLLLLDQNYGLINVGLKALRVPLGPLNIQS